MDQELFTRLWEHAEARVSGPMRVRLIVQPAVAMILAARAAVHDLAPDHAPSRRSLWQRVGLAWSLACGIDCIFQIAVFQRLFPGEAMIVASLLALLPYTLVLGVVTRFARPQVRR